MKRIVLLRPSGPRNAGMIVRIVQNFGPAELVFVAPERPSLLIHPEFEQMSHGAKSVESMLRVVETTEEALADCTDSVGFTARVRGGRLREDWRDVIPDFAALGGSPERRLALVFGNETTGMNAEESLLCQRLVHIPTSQEHTSLNLAIAVSVVLSSLFVSPRTHGVEPGGSPVTGAAREFLKANLKWAMTEKVARGDRAKIDIAASIDRVFSKSELETRDARAWHMMARALGSQKTPMDFGLDPNPTVQESDHTLG